MSKRFSIIISCLLVLNCAQDKKISEVFQTDQLNIEQVTKNVYKHISFLDTETYGKVSCNGMVYINNKEAIIYDTPANDVASKQLVDWIQLTHSSNIKAVVVTHFHEDCLGGLKPFHDLNISSYASNHTRSLIKDSTKIIPNSTFNTLLKLQIGTEETITQYFGEGHTKDNVVGYIPSEKALFGGCLIKALEAKKGNLADANVEDWSQTVTAIKTEYPDIKYVIPGHGNHGNLELLNYTIDLFSTPEEDK